ncbi:MAG: hypothetical protein F4169_04580 [Gammaproteobacteria bacterium]|nr:hypothetical protein [Rhodothermaceae bacterium]MYF28130.1 hypothetical protein [Gammaproteobacteria bacterium]
MAPQRPAQTIEADLDGRTAQIEIGRPTFGQVADAVDGTGPVAEIALVRHMVKAIDGVPVDDCDFQDALAALEAVTAFMSAAATSPAASPTPAT